jgi:hypothetical protein
VIFIFLFRYYIIIMSTTVLLAAMGGVILVLLIIVSAMASKSKPSCPECQSSKCPDCPLPDPKEYIRVPAGKKVFVFGQNGQQYVALDFNGGVGDTTNVNWTEPIWMPYGFKASGKCNTVAPSGSVKPVQGPCVLGMGDC